MKTMNNRILIACLISALMIVFSCNSQETITEKKQSDQKESVESKIRPPHKYGGWYCPDNFGFVPVDIYKLDVVPAISNRLPTEQELKDHKSLIKIDTKLYPEAKALDMDLPRVARIYSESKKMSELIIVIQAVIVGEDTIVGYRFPNGGNGSDWISAVSFLSNEEVEEMGPQPFFYSKSTLKASKDDIWKAIGTTEYGKELLVKFNRQDLYDKDWYSSSWPHLKIEDDEGKIHGYVGIVFGNLYLQLDYNKNGKHYSEKILMIEHPEDNTTELFFASGPFPDDYKDQNLKWSSWVEAVVESSVAR